MTQTTADIDLIKRIIPHRYPFLLIDKVVDIELGKSAVGIKNVTYNEPHFQGHFPATPIMPGVMIVEAMAQTASVMVALTLDLLDKNALVYFMSIDNCKFRRKVVPGDVLKLSLEATRGKVGSKVWKLRGVATVDGQVAAEADISAMIDAPTE
ncbi:3-hydroxyacyl-ACP dehydratase FabZ [Litoreibacter roseus]|uniref:3-hydroxyacyl-[acyl-carrier-protein] dehydratase FabZ n=1 Tax=Litoreibacter roseus TaxID=2601869 RepID=A0A6N6JLJ1_9RHOB|nr:3-hydroxyacyl-ACP dehydratase FabZ [Litoreibacter roseus]GFE66827.1 3-hydroxyacyl-[acyl-carrier-protein] dehydratase FabZ [Litoreibacter roseus]